MCFDDICVVGTGDSGLSIDGLLAGGRPRGCRSTTQHGLPHPQERTTAGRESDYWMSSNTPKMGMYKAMIMPPMMAPRTAIIRGSMSEVSASVVDSTSWS